MKKILNYKICINNNGVTIDAFLRSHGFSRHIIAHLKRTENGICLNGVWAFANQMLSDGDLLSVNLIEDNASPNIIPVNMPLVIPYEDDDFMIIDKPADTPIHPAINNYENSLANGLAWYFKKQDIPFVFRCINRLDRDTTGLLIVAKHMLSAALLSKMVADRDIHREYLAIADGITPPLGTIDAPIARKSDSLIERCVDFSNGERAVTYFHTVKTIDGCSLVALKLETGRTHQIRIHMKHLGFPLVGDTLYHPDIRKESAMQTLAPERGRFSDHNTLARSAPPPEGFYSVGNEVSFRIRMQRQALHSHRLCFVHPLTGENMDFHSPLPADMEWIL